MKYSQFVQTRPQRWIRTTFRCGRKTAKRDFTFVMPACLSVRPYFSKNHHHHHKHQGLGSLNRSVSRVTAALSNVSSVFQMFSFLVVCSGMISKVFGFVAFFASVEASPVCIHLSCIVCL